MLDGTAIFDTAEAAIFKARDARQERAYFAKALHLFLATTNLRGVPYRILYTGSDDPTEGHVMMLHGDRIHYEFQGVGTNTFTSPWLKGYGEKGIPISPPQFAEAKVRHAFLEASLCTGALPLGLPARLVERQTADFASRAWPYRLDEKIQNIVPNWPSRCNGTRDYVVSYAGSDGGIIDNEPFELARWTLMADPNAHHEPSARHTDRAVVIVDPFPKPPAFDPELSGQELQEQVWLRAVLRSLVPALKNQLRVKAIDLARAGKADVYSRFLIAPSRQIYRVIGRVRVPVETADDLASGVFGAFGGFLSTKFAEHDYQLGRRNCQQFLRTRFALPPTTTWLRLGRRRQPRSLALAGMAGTICRSASIEVEPHEWPRVGNDVIEEFLRHVRRLGDALVDKIAREELKRWVFRLAARFGWRIYKSDVLNTIRLTLTADLIRRDQHEEWARLESDLDRLIIAALYEPAYHAQSPERLARSINRRSHGRKDMQTTTADDVKGRLNGALARYVVTLSHSGGDAFRLRSHWRKPPRFCALSVDEAQIKSR